MGPIVGDQSISRHGCLVKLCSAKKTYKTIQDKFGLTMVKQTMSEHTMFEQNVLRQTMSRQNVPTQTISGQIESEQTMS